MIVYKNKWRYMTVSNSAISSASFNNNSNIRSARTNNVEKNYDASRVELSTRAILSEEYNSNEYDFPVFNPDALTYTKQSKILYKP